jgi:hypothetical protein
MFSCKQLGTNPDDLYLLPDLSQKCYTSDHQFWIVAVGLPLLLLYVLGVPLFAFYKLYTRSALIDECEGKSKSIMCCFAALRLFCDCFFVLFCSFA